MFEELKARESVYQSNNMEEVEKLLNSKEKITFYCGFDPTAPSIHIGHFSTIILMKRLQDAGHKPIVLLGGATGIIGDPTGRRTDRKQLTLEEVKNNIKTIENNLRRYLSFEGDNACIVVNNYDWISKLNLLEYMQGVALNFNVSEMLSRDSCKNRLESGGLTFLEMMYQTIQAYDFYHLYVNYGCTLEIAGSDQWANMIVGTELIKKRLGKDTYCLSAPLLLDKNGNKMGKSAGNAIWVDETLTSDYDLYQYLINIEDESIEKLLNRYTFVSLEEIKNIMSKDIRLAKRDMAYLITKFIRGADAANKVQKLSDEVFSGNTDSMEIINLGVSTMSLIDLLIEVKLASSKSDARRSIEQNSISIDNIKITDVNYIVDLSTEKVIKKGKKTFVKVSI